MVDYVQIKEMARAFRGNLIGWPSEVIKQVHMEILDDDIYLPSPDILDCIHSEIVPILEKAKDQKDAENKINLELKGSCYWKYLGCWLSDYRNSIFVVEVFEEFRNQTNSNIFQIVNARHQTFKRRIGESFLKALIERSKHEK